MMPRLRLLPFVLAAVQLGGCGGLLLGPEEPAVATYLFAPELPRGVRQEVQEGPVLSVSRPQAAAGYATRRMAYLEQDFRIDYFARNAWADAPAEMLRPLLLTALNASYGFRTVIEDAHGVDSDLRLDILVVRLHQDFRARPSRASLVLRAQLVDLQVRRVLATRRFEGEEPAPSEDAYGGVVAINRILARLLGEVAAFAAEVAGSRR